MMDVFSLGSVAPFMSLTSTLNRLRQLKSQLIGEGFWIYRLWSQASEYSFDPDP
jgi:hypothetical protein